MAVPKRKTSISRKKMRRSHHKLSSVNIVEDKKSGEYKLSHHVDLKSGYYNGKNTRYQKYIMSKKISIAIDAMGGDNSPDKTIEGIKFFLEKNKNESDFVLNIFGREKDIKEKLIKYKIKSNLINLINTDMVVSDDEKPLTAVKNSKNTSMWNCIKHQLEGKSDISLSAGNTGVLLVISRMILKMMNEVTKPALAGYGQIKRG